MRPSTTRRLHSAGNTALAWGGGALAIGTAAAVLVPTGGPSWLPFLFKALAISGGAATAGGLICHTTDACGKGFSFLKNLLWGVEIDYTYRLASRAELDDIYRIGHEEIGDEVLGPEVLKKWFDRNEDLFWILIEQRTRLRPIRNRRETTVGYFILIPLSNDAATSMGKGDLLAKDFTVDHIASTDENPAAIYLSAVCARPGKARGVAVMNYLRAEMRAWVKRGVRVCLTRPVTKRGLDLANLHGFDPVNPGHQEDLGVIRKRVYRDHERP